MSWNFESLGSIVDLSKGRKHTIVDGGFNRYINIEDLHNPANEVYTNDKGTFVNENDLIIAWDGANAGKVGVGFEGVIGSTLARIRIHENMEVNPRFLYWFLESKNDLIKSQRTGATIPHINGSALKDLQIPLPPLPVQQRIAEILDAADALRRKDQALLQKYDELAQSIFIDMFGDPVKNEKGWEVRKLGDFGKVITGNTPSRAEKSNYDSNFIEWIKTDNIKENNLFVSKAKEYLSQRGARKGRVAQNGTLLVACIAGSIDSIGRASLTDREVCFNQQINAICPNSRVNSIFLYYLFKFSREHIQAYASNGMKRMLSKGEFEKIEMILPDLDSQESFENVIKHLEQKRENLKAAAEHSSNLFEILLCNAFDKASDN